VPLLLLLERHVAGNHLSKRLARIRGNLCQHCGLVVANHGI
jgi:hypothetical protein